MKRLTLILALAVTSALSGGTAMQGWNQFEHRPEGVRHVSFRIEKSHFHLRWGPCGPQTSEIDWLYWIDLDGERSEFAAEQVQIRRALETGTVKPASGSVRIAKLGYVDIQLKVLVNGVVTDFEGNGRYAINAK